MKAAELRFRELLAEARVSGLDGDLEVYRWRSRRRFERLVELS